MNILFIIKIRTTSIKAINALQLATSQNILGGIFGGGGGHCLVQAMFSPAETVYAVKIPILLLS